MVAIGVPVVLAAPNVHQRWAPVELVGAIRGCTVSMVVVTVVANMGAELQLLLLQVVVAEVVGCVVLVLINPVPPLTTEAGEGVT